MTHKRSRDKNHSDGREGNTFDKKYMAGFLEFKYENNILEYMYALMMCIHLCMSCREKI